MHLFMEKFYRMKKVDIIQQDATEPDVFSVGLVAI